MKLQEATYIYMMLHAYRSVRYMQYALRMHHASLADCIRTAESTSNTPTQAVKLHQNISLSPQGFRSP